ncbi:MAG TPA: 16S rRNA (guanine(527)-N(7))-methyltransferase RsmG [Thermoleophilaceae bacterium]
MPVADRLDELASTYRLPDGSAARLERLLSALEAEPDPHTTVFRPEDAVDQHIADSLSALLLAPVRAAKTLVDIGAGAGFPGLPLAVALPDAHVDLLESARRKCAVIERLAKAADIANARAVNARAEEWAAAEGREAYDVATARAVASLAVLVEYAAPLLKTGGAFVAWKGTPDRAEEEAGAAAAEVVGLRLVEVLNVVPFAGARALNLHLYSKVRETPDRFPRRPGAASKRPLA